MLNKKDPLIDAIKQVMQNNQADRDAVKAVNEKFGIQDRRVLPHERQGEWDAAYQTVLSEGLHPNKQKLDVHEPEKNKLTKHDFKMLRAKKKPMEEAANKFRSDYGLGAAAAPKDAAADRAKIDKAMEPVVNTVKAFTPGATALDKATQGDYKGAAIDAGIDALGGAAVGGIFKAGKGIYNTVKGSSKVATGTEKAATSVANALPTSAPVKPVSAAAREGGSAVPKVTKGTGQGNRIAGEGGSAVPKVTKGTGQGNRIAAQRKPEDGPWGSTKPEVKTPPRTSSSPSGTFAANLQKARQSAQSGRVGGSTVGATQQAAKLASRSKLAQSAQSGRVGGSTVGATQQAAKLAVRQRLSATAKDIRTEVGRVVNKVDDAIKKNPKAAAAGAAGIAGIAVGRSISTNNPPPVNAATTQTSGPSFEKTGRGSAPSVPSAQTSGPSFEKTGRGSAPSVATPAKTQPAAKTQTAKPGTQQAVKDRVVQKVATRAKLQTRYQRDNTIGADGRPTKGPGGVTTGTKTGTTFSTKPGKPGIAKKAPVGTGRVK